MKKIFKLAAMVAASLAIFSCTPEEGNGNENGDGNGNGNGNGNTVVEQELKFTLGEPEVEATQVTIRVEHDGDKTDNWHYIVTAKTSKIEEAIAAEVERILNSTTSTTLQNVTKKNVVVTDLTPETEYTFIVFGITTGGSVYGTPASVDFKTALGEVTELTQTNDWTASYQRGDYEGETAELITIDCAENLTYYVSYAEIWYLEEIQETYGMTVEDYAMWIATTEFPEMLNYGYRMEDLLVTGPGELAFPRMVSDDYLLFIIGFTTDGQITGTFSTYEFTVEQETATPEYEKWFGTWKLTSAPESFEYENEIYEFQNSFYIDVYPYDNNYMYVIGGWECGENQYVDFTTAFGEPIYFPVSYADAKMEFEEYFIDYMAASSGSTTAELAFGLWGICDVVVGDQTYYNDYIAYEGLTMGIAEISADGLSGEINGVTHKDIGYGIDQVTYTAMAYMGVPIVEGVQLQMYNDYMKFPISMEKVADLPEVASAKKKVANSTIKSDSKVELRSARKPSGKLNRKF